MNEESAIEAFAALAQETRMAIFRLLVRIGPEGLPAGEIGRRLHILPSTLSGHLSVLRRSGLLAARRQKREIHYSANLETVNALVGFLLSDCCAGKIENCASIISLLSAEKAQEIS